MTVIVTALSPDVAISQWPALRAMVDLGFAVGGEIMPEDFLDRVRDGKVLLWVAIDDETATVLTVVTTALVRMRSGLVCWIGQCSGTRMREWVGFISKIEEYARAEGCVKTVLQGRDGWRGILKDYQLRTVTLEKAL